MHDDLQYPHRTGKRHSPLMPQQFRLTATGAKPSITRHAPVRGYIVFGVMLTICPGCGVELPSLDGPVHRYMESSPACWAAYGEVLAREYQNPAYMAVHRLTVDTYAVQHPGRPGPQATQSVGAHLISLLAIVERGASQTEATQLLGRAVANIRFSWLEPLPSMGLLTVVSVLPTSTAAEHAQAVERWAASAWQAWSAYHSVIRKWALQLDNA